MVTNKPQNPVNLQDYIQLAKISGQTPKPTSPPSIFSTPTKPANHNSIKK